MKINFHVHSSFSYDGFNSLKAIYQTAKACGLDAIALTDHDCFDGVKALNDWMRRNGKADLQIIPAEEVTCLDGTHIIGLFLNKKIERGTPQDVCAEIKAQGGFVYFPHPVRHDGILSSAACDEVLPMGDFYECFNAKIDDNFNRAAMTKLQDKMPPLGGSDAHYNIDIKKCYCELESAGDLKETLAVYRKHRTIAIYGKRKFGATNYFPIYYKYKKYIPLPQFVRDLGKKIVPWIKNMRDRGKTVALEKIYPAT
ncbi:MAG: PHP domain-containing protein [Cyclobacteriaceae bacterium]|jgi:predicted metal-dependent phosphoesterase TrpH|nr:PHP domain-containing protein [Cyclobacteriaceae bacterium]